MSFINGQMTNMLNSTPVCNLMYSTVKTRTRTSCSSLESNKHVTSFTYFTCICKYTAVATNTKPSTTNDTQSSPTRQPHHNHNHYGTCSVDIFTNKKYETDNTKLGLLIIYALNKLYF